MVPVEVVCSLSKVAIQGDQPLCLGVMTVSIETCRKAVGSEAYVHLVGTLGFRFHGKTDGNTE